MDYHVRKGYRAPEDLEEFNYENTRYGVIVDIVDEDERILLQKRGPKSRDEQGLYENVGGEYEPADGDFKTSIIREIKEEMGSSFEYVISDIMGIYHCKKGNINWLFAVFKARHIRGNPEVMEKDKCSGYRYFTYDELMSSDDVTQSCKFLVKSIRVFKDTQDLTKPNV